MTLKGDTYVERSLSVKEQVAKIEAKEQQIVRSASGGTPRQDDTSLYVLCLESLELFVDLK